MSGAWVLFFKMDGTEASPGEEQAFSFKCPMSKNKDQRCGKLVIAGKTELKRSPNGVDGTPQWDWNGSRSEPTFQPSIDCQGCWHGYIRNGRCVDTHGKEEPESLDI